MSTLNTLSQYGSGFQIKVLSSLLKHREFLHGICDILNPEEFDSPAHRWIVEETLKYYSKYHTNPTPEYMSVEVKKISNDVLKVSVVDQLKESLKAINDDKEYVETEFSNFCRNQQLKKALMNSVDLLSKGQYDDIRSMIDQALKAGQSRDIGHEYEKDIETRYRAEERAAVPTIWPNINEMLMGGLGAGDLGIVLGSPGGGKSWFLVNLGAAAVKAGFTVNHYTLELAQDYTGKRYDSLLTGIEFQKIHLHREEVERVVASLPGKLIIKEYPMGKTTVSTIETHIQKCTSLGHKPDLIIIDYVDLLRSKRSGERKDEIDDVYTSIKGLARQIKTPIWTVSQVNRTGSKDDIIEADKIAGSYDKVMIADFIMSLSRKRKDKLSKTGRVHIIKNRFGSDGMTYGATIDTSNGHITIDTEELDESQINMEDSQSFSSGSFQSLKRSPMFASDEKRHLANKFFELGI
jgi:replicative DNA helicase